MIDCSPLREPQLVGTTPPSLSEFLHPRPTTPHQTSNYFKSTQWSPDGTTLLTHHADNTLRTFIVPPTLLSPPHPHTLSPYTTHPHPEPIYASAFHPSYTLAEPSTCLILASLRSLPLRLISPFAPGILASYPLVSPTTEAYIAPHSIVFSQDNPNHFLAGSDSCISLFDITRNGEGPVSNMRTTPSKRNHNAFSGGMKGIISALGMSGEGVLAAGTFSRWVGLYDSHGRGDTIAIFPLSSPSDADSERGQGVTQVIWSACNRYLCIAERGSDGISVCDVRKFDKRLAWLKGRTARTQQRLGVDVLGSEVWAGGTDGMVKIWEGLGMRQGAVEPSLEFKAHDDVVSSATLHPTGSVLATCSGQRHWNGSVPSDDDGMESDSSSDLSCGSSLSSNTSTTLLENKSIDISDNSMKLWAL